MVRFSSLSLRCVGSSEATERADLEADEGLVLGQHLPSHLRERLVKRLAS